MKNLSEIPLDKKDKLSKIDFITQKVRQTFLDILYVKLGEENQFGLTPMGGKILGRVGYVDKNSRFIIKPKYNQVSKFSDDGLVRCGLPDPHWIIPGVFSHEIRNHIGEILDLVEEGPQCISLLRVKPENELFYEDPKESGITRKATVFGLIPSRVLWFHGGWLKPEEIPFLKPKIEDISISEKNEILRREDLQKKLFGILKGSRSVKRALPSNPERLEKIISDSIKDNLPIPIFQYWGMGARNIPGKHEDDCFQNLKKTFDEIGSIYYSGVSLSLIFCDTHMEINGFSEDHRISYLQALLPVAEAYGWKVSCMSEIIGMSPKDFHIKVRENVKDFPIPEIVYEKLLISASRRPIRDDYENAAQEYWTANMLEGEKIKTDFSNKIFLTFNDPQDDVLFPDEFTILHWYPIKKGRTDKPWFMEELG